MQLCANKLDKKDFFGKSDPFLVFYRSNEDGTYVWGRVTPHSARAGAQRGAAGVGSCLLVPALSPTSLVPPPGSQFATRQKW